jgi:hypothetical protein
MDKDKDKKNRHDLRDEVPAPTSITNTNSRMAGGADNANVSGADGTPLKKPGVTQREPDGNNVSDS